MRLLDLFCGAGGSAVGYSRAGFTEIVGVDNKPQKHFPFAFHQADALEYIAEHGREFDAIHASPPCQYYSRLRHLPWLKTKVYWRSIPPTRAALQATGKPWVIENVEDAGGDMPDSIILCGQMLGLSLFRHRRFEAWPGLLLQPVHQTHNGVIASGRASLGKRHHGQQGFKEISRESETSKSGRKSDVERRRLVTGINWMTGAELAQAVPPAYCEFVGKQLLQAIEAVSP